MHNISPIHRLLRLGPLDWQQCSETSPLLRYSWMPSVLLMFRPPSVKVCVHCILLLINIMQASYNSFIDLQEKLHQTIGR